jgi:hypothetical protein
MRQRPCYLVQVPEGFHAHGAFDGLKDRLRDDVSRAASSVNSRLLQIIAIASGDMESKTLSTLAHDFFVGDMARSGYVRGHRNSKPDLLLWEGNTHYWIEVKASTRRDWQGHPTKDQLPPPDGNIHILLDVDKATGLIREVFCVCDAKWVNGSSKNGEYQRLSKEDHARKLSMWTAVTLPHGDGQSEGQVCGGGSPVAGTHRGLALKTTGGAEVQPGEA